MDSTTPTLVAYAPLGVKIQPGFSSDTYLLDIRTADGPVAQLTGTVPADGKIALSESNVALDTVKYIRVRAVDGATSAYSSPITLFIDPSVGPATPNQVRSLTVSRNGLNIEVLAGLYQDNGRMVNLYFQGPDDPAPIAVTNLNVPAGPNLVKIVLDNTSLSAPCGQMTTTQDGGAGGEIPFSEFVDHATGQYSQIFSTNQICDSRFFGIVIAMYFDDHAPPHFHARYGRHEAQIEIHSLVVLRGRLPPRVRGLVTEWAEMHASELLEDWELARAEHRTKPLTAGES